MKDQKVLMAEVALMYYKDGLTQQEIAVKLDLTRQTVSKLLTSAVSEGIVEIKVHNPDSKRHELQDKIEKKYGVKAGIFGASNNSEDLRSIATIEGAISYLSPIVQRGGLNIALSWGRTVQKLVKSFPALSTLNNTVYPLFGATEHEQSYYLPNELAREFAGKLSARVKYAWFPYKVDNEQDFELFKRTAYYKKMLSLWADCDAVVVGIGNNTAFRLLDPDFKGDKDKLKVVGDVATHFFTEDGTIIENKDLTLRIDVDTLMAVKTKIAVAYGDDKISAIKGALNSRLVDVLITDEYTAKGLL